MLKSLVWKEFREVLPICATAIAAQLILVAYAVNVWRIHQPRDAYGVWPLLYLVALLLGVAIGIWQNVRDDNQSTFQFLLHRPVKRSVIFTTRLTVGVVSSMIVGLLPLVCFTLWMEGMVPNRGEGTWEPLRGLCAGIWLLYAGAFLSVLRPGAGTAAGFCHFLPEYFSSSSYRLLSARLWPFFVFRMQTSPHCIYWSPD